MNRTIYIRNMAVFLLFVAIIFATPYLFAQVANSTPQQYQEVTSPSLIQIDGDNISIPLYTRSLRSQNGTQTGGGIEVTKLPKGSVIRLPDPVIAQLQVDTEGNILMYETLLVWGETLAAKDRRLMPRRVNGKLVFPVKILKDGDGDLDISSRNAVGYVPLTDLLRPGAFSTVRAEQKQIEKQEEALALTVQENKEAEKAAPTSSEQVFFYDPSYDDEPSLDPRNQVTIAEEPAIEEAPEEGQSETTGGVNGSIRPPLRPERPAYTTRPGQGTYAPSTNPEFNCNHTTYSLKFRTNSCFTQQGYDLEDKASHILGDLEAINQWRKDAQGKANQPRVDPRFSLCIAYHETGGHLAPNADSGAGDYGLYQIRNNTGAGVLAKYGMITEGYTHLNTNSEYYRYQGATSQGLKSRMAGDPLAQSDLHHSIIVEKARMVDNKYFNPRKWTSTVCHDDITYRLGMGSATSDDYQCLADFYNASKRRRSYAKKIRNCLDRTKEGVIDSAGNITNPARLKWALDAAVGK